MTTKEFLKNILYTKNEVKEWLAGRAFPFAKYSSEFGWLLPNALFRDGMDDSVCTYTYAPTGERKMVNFANQPCRINTYGNSFTQCHQVSDGESWQEYLAAHLQEPIRNFGIGGWSVYQAYLRMLDEEERVPSDLIIFNIYDDDHFRNLTSWRTMRSRKHKRFIEPTLPYLEVNPAEDTFKEHPNPCPTPESNYNLCDLNWVYERFKDDFVLQIMLAHENAKAGNPEKSYADIMSLTMTHGIDTRIDEGERFAESAQELYRESAYYATRKLVDKIQAFCEENGKRVLFVLSHSGKSVARYLDTGVRYDAPFRKFMDKKNLPMIDLIDAHAVEFSQFKLSVTDYIKRYYIGHYMPLGNMFCAMAIRRAVVDLLEPKPIPYREHVGVLGKGD